MFHLSSTLLSVVLTDWPPGPDERTVVICSSDSGMTTPAAILTPRILTTFLLHWQSPSEPDSRGGSCGFNAGDDLVGIGVGQLPVWVMQPQSNRHAAMAGADL